MNISIYPQSRDGRGRPGDKQGDAKRLRSTRRETRRGLWRWLSEAAGSRSRGTRQGAALGAGTRKPQACGAAELVPHIA